MRSWTRISVTLGYLLVFSGAGCRTLEYRYDNPELRAIQEAHFDAGPKTLIRGEPVVDYIGRRSAWIVADESMLFSGSDRDEGETLDLGGRAAAISEDGYFLTAGHIVEDGAPILLIAPGDPFRGYLPFVQSNPKALFRIRGRVVRRFEGADLTLLKFPQLPVAHFDAFNEQPQVGIDVFCADPRGLIDQETGIGNGPFRARGVTLRVRDSVQSDGPRRIKTSIFSRGGMSGAPIVDREGRLVAILTHGIVNPWRRVTAKPPHTLGQMISRDVVEFAIEEDRRANEVSASWLRPVQ